MKNLKGFTMVEVLIAITIIAVIGVFSSTILTRTYRAGTQTTRISTLKQNGELALNIMSEEIRNSEGIVCYGPSVGPKTEIVIRTLAGKYVKFKFVGPDKNQQTGVVIANGYIIKQENLNPSDFANFCTSTLVLPVEVPITNKDETSGVSISDGEFRKLTQTTSKDAVFITYNVNPTKSEDGVGGSEVILMETTVQVR